MAVRRSDARDDPRLPVTFDPVPDHEHHRGQPILRTPVREEDGELPGHESLPSARPGAMAQVRGGGRRGCWVRDECSRAYAQAHLG